MKVLVAGFQLVWLPIAFASVLDQMASYAPATPLRNLGNHKQKYRDRDEKAAMDEGCFNDATGTRVSKENCPHGCCQDDVCGTTADCEEARIVKIIKITTTACVGGGMCCCGSAAMILGCVWWYKKKKKRRAGGGGLRLAKRVCSQLLRDLGRSESSIEPFRLYLQGISVSASCR